MRLRMHGAETCLLIGPQKLASTLQPGGHDDAPVWAPNLVLAALGEESVPANPTRHEVST